MKQTDEIKQIMRERFGHDTLLSLATASDNIPSVRIVDSLYENGAFYVITYAMSNKMKQIALNPNVAVCGEWFSGKGIAYNLGWVRDEKNAGIMPKLRTAFSSWYGNGHVNEEDENTVILCIKLTSCTLFSNGTRYDVDFAAR